MYKHKMWHFLHLESTHRAFRYSFAFAGMFYVIYVSVLFIQGETPSSQLLSDIAVALCAFASFVIAWMGDKLPGKRDAASQLLPLERRLRFWVPFAFSIALLLQGFGNSMFVYYDLRALETPPILAEVMIMGTYLALLAGILLLPRDALSGKVPLRFAMESLMLIAMMVTFSWYFLLGPTLLQSQRESFMLVVLSAALPVLDLLVISCLILLSHSLAEPRLRAVFRALLLALVIFVFTDSILAYQVLSGPPSYWLSLGWIAGNFVIALSLQTMRRNVARTTAMPMSAPGPSALVATPMWRTMLAYTLVPAVLVLVLYLWAVDRTSFLAIGTYVCSLLLLVVIFVKQFAEVQEIHGLNRGFQRLQRMVEEKNIALGEANARLEALATTDPLTELPNHRALVTALDQELARSWQYARSCSLLFFDIDHFKALNDGYGHAGGDTALREFGTLLRATLPVLNTVGRWGGEEFVAILPEQDAVAAAACAEELRSAVATHSFPVGGGMHLTCSIGVASFPAHAQQQTALLQAADSAMYGAKKLGRNQVRVIDDPAVIALLATNSGVEGRDEATLIGTVHALALLVEKRDVHIGEHAQRVGELLMHLAQSLGLSETEAQLLSLAGQLHDVGKIVIPDSILQKQGPLTEQEFVSIRQHAQVGAEVVSSIPSLRPLAPIIHAHHEHWDGTGYPNHLAGDAIPFGARLLAVVDAYVVMTKEDPERDAQEQHAHALAELQQGAGTQFDPAVVEQFLLLSPTIQATKEKVRVV